MSKGGVLEERILRLLQEVSSLREKLDTSIRNYNTLAEELRERLGHTSSVGGVSTYTSKWTSTRKGMGKDTGSGSNWDHTHKHRSVHTKSAVSSGVQTRLGGQGRSCVNSPFLSTLISSTSLPPLAPPPSNIPLPLPLPPSPCPSLSTASSSPKSSPRSYHYSKNFTDSPSPRSRGGANLDSSSSNSFLSSHASSTRILEGEGSGGRDGRRTRPAQHLSRHTSVSLKGFGDFESLENRLQKVLASPSVQVSYSGYSGLLVSILWVVVLHNCLWNEENHTARTVEILC